MKRKKYAKKTVPRLKYDSYMISVDAGVSILEHVSALASLDYTPVLKDEQPN